MLRPGEFASLKGFYKAALLEDQQDGTSLIRLPQLPVPQGWNFERVECWFLAPNGYPAAPPDCFWTDPGLRLSSGAMPANSGLQVIRGLQRLWFSWHVTNWHPSKHDLASFVRFIQGRFRDIR